jgi:hypothetical protein
MFGLWYCEVISRAVAKATDGVEGSGFNSEQMLDQRRIRGWLWNPARRDHIAEVNDMV